MNQFPCLIRSSTPGGEDRYAGGLAQRPEHRQAPRGTAGSPRRSRPTESPWDVRRLSVLDMKESNEFSQGFESAALHAC